MDELLMEQQLLYMGVVAAQPSGHVLRDMNFSPNTHELAPLSGPRCKGRPRAAWANQVYKAAFAVAGNEQALTRMWAPTPAAKAAWQAAVRQHDMKNMFNAI